MEQTRVRDLDYAEMLAQFFRDGSEMVLYNASRMAVRFVEEGIGPEEIVSLHQEALERLLRTHPGIEGTRLTMLSFQVLVEIMIAYGIRYKEYLDLRAGEEVRRERQEAEIRQARAEEQIRLQSQAIAERENFLSFVAHELRNPLTILLGNIDYLLSSPRAADPEKQVRILGNLRKASERLQALVTNLLAISRVQRAESALDLKPISMQTVIEDAVDEVVLQATDRRIALDVHVDPALPPVRGDETSLIRLLSNLLENGIKYTPIGGQVTVRAVRENGRVRVEVADTGQGIPPEELPHVFDLYHRARSSGTPFAKGSGLGLALAKTIVDRHGGEIQVASTAGTGTIFTIRLHLADG